MGLDITAYCVCKDLGPAQEGIDNDPRWDEENVTYVFVEPHFVQRADGLSDRHFYSYEDSLSFRAGSYGGYSAWRNLLAQFAGYPKCQPRERDELYPDFQAASREANPYAWGAFEQEKEEGPFYELINMSDCEGVIGPKTSAKLAKDFHDHLQRAREELKDYDLSRYEYWMQAFEMASRDGFVKFH
jgi:hypothetical protein